ncbi:putative thiamine transporter SLC35F3 [Trichonephila clavipes]|uniref:Putative thiamine transporter SLC35F3 n=1 Tax=Trichonephila clavipes TaxID=2585209 RepID=A0A8X6V239_TRICX|nr:putative thiamine transporter SLC35F3 [Trichonephila clavipes]
MSENIELCNLPHLIEDNLFLIEALVNADLDQDIIYICSLLGQDKQQQLENVDKLFEIIDQQIISHANLFSQNEQYQATCSTCNDIHFDSDGDNDIYEVDDNSSTNPLRAYKKWTGKKDKILEVRQRIQELSEDPTKWNEASLNYDDAQLEHNDLNPRKSNHCCTGRARKTALGFFFTVVMCGTWIGVTHLLKWAYTIHLKPPSSCNNCTLVNVSRSFDTPSTAVLDLSSNKTSSKHVTTLPLEKEESLEPFKAPFLMTWFCTACNCLFFPIYLCTRFFSRRTRITARRSILEAMRRFRERGLSAIHFLTRSMFFCVLWVGTNYMLIYTIDKLDATAVMALQASRASFVYLLSWVILHEQFVGIRIVAVILCNTGIALLAYMDGVARTSTLGGVVLAAAAAAGLSVHKVLFKKLIGRVTLGQLSIFLTLVGLLNILLLWPIGLTLYLVESEKVIWTELPYVPLAGSALFFIGWIAIIRREKIVMNGNRADPSRCALPMGGAKQGMAASSSTNQA